MPPWKVYWKNNLKDLGLNCLRQMRGSVNPATAEWVISHVQADFADGRDSQRLPGITLKLQ